MTTTTMKARCAPSSRDGAAWPYSGLLRRKSEEGRGKWEGGGGKAKGYCAAGRVCAILA